MPAGYVAYGNQPFANVRPSQGLGKATVVLFWSVTVLSGLLMVALFARRTTVEGFFEGSSSIGDIDRSDGLVAAAALLQIAAQVASVILVCLWSKRIADNAKARGVHDISPGLAAGGWFIPIGYFFVGFNQLKKAVTFLGGTAKSLNAWQVAFLVAGVAGMIGRFVTTDFEASATESEFVDQLNNEVYLALVALIGFAVAAFFASKAIKQVNQAVTGDAA